MKLKEITIEITQQCPNYCIHCSSMSSLSKNHMMPLEKVKELIDDVDILGCEQISFSGGEPFLHKEIIINFKKMMLNSKIMKINFLIMI